MCICFFPSYLGSFDIAVLIFFPDRHTKVKHQIFESAQFIITSEIFHGDHLTTLLFNIYLNDLVNM